MELRQLEPAVAVRGPHHCDIDPDIVQPGDAVHSAALDCRLALQLQAELEEKRSRSLEVFDDDADVIHSLDRHGQQGT